MSSTVLLQPMTSQTEELIFPALSYQHIVVTGAKLTSVMSHAPALPCKHNVDDDCNVVLEATELHIPALHSTAACLTLPTFSTDSQTITAVIGNADAKNQQSCPLQRDFTIDDGDSMQATCSQLTLKTLRNSPSVEVVEPAIRRVSAVALPVMEKPSESFVVCMSEDSLAVTTASPVSSAVEEEARRAEGATAEPREAPPRIACKTNKQPPSEDGNRGGTNTVTAATRQPAVTLTHTLLTRPTAQGERPASRRHVAAPPHPGATPFVRRTIKADSEPNASVTLNDDGRAFVAKERRTSGTAGVPAATAHESPAMPFLPSARHPLLRHGLFASPQISLQVRRYSDESTVSGSHVKGNEDSRTFVEPMRRGSELSCPSVRGMSPATMGNGELSSFHLFHGLTSPPTNRSFGSRATSRPLAVFPAAPPACMRYSSISSSTPMLVNALALPDEAASRDEAGQAERVYSPGSPHLGSAASPPLGAYPALPPPAPPTTTRYQRFANNAVATLTAPVTRPPCPKITPEAPYDTEGDTESETAVHGEMMVESGQLAAQRERYLDDRRPGCKGTESSRTIDFDDDDDDDEMTGPTGGFAFSSRPHSRLNTTERHAATLPHPVDALNALGIEELQGEEEAEVAVRRKAMTCRPRLGASISRLPPDRPPRASVAVNSASSTTHGSLSILGNEVDGPMAGSATPELPSPVTCGRSRGFDSHNDRRPGDDVLDEERLLRQSLPGELRARMLNNAYMSISSASDDAEEHERHSAMREAQLGGFYRKVIALWRESRAMSEVNVEADEDEEKGKRAPPPSPGVMPSSPRRASERVRDAPLPMLTSITTTSSSVWAAHDGGHSARQRSVAFAVPNEMREAKSTDVIM